MPTQMSRVKGRVLPYTVSKYSVLMNHNGECPIVPSVHFGFLSSCLPRLGDARYVLAWRISMMGELWRGTELDVVVVLSSMMQHRSHLLSMRLGKSLKYTWTFWPARLGSGDIDLGIHMGIVSLHILTLVTPASSGWMPLRRSSRSNPPFPVCI